MPVSGVHFRVLVWHTVWCKGNYSVSKEVHMDARGGKILEFLKENSHLDLEVPDIAFNVKKSEKTVEAALKKFQQKGLVTARQNEFGRVYWYALPSAPITKILQADELLPKTPEAASAEDDDEAVDLFSLPKAPPVSKPAVDKKEEKPATSTRRKPRTVKTVPKAEVEEVTIEKNESITADTAFEPAPKIDSVEESPSFEEAVDEVPVRSVNALRIPVLVAGAVAVLAVIIGVNALGRGGKLEKKIAAVEQTIPKDVATSAELIEVKSQLSGIAALEEKVTTLSGLVDSLSNEIVKINEEKTKKPVYRKRKRR